MSDNDIAKLAQGFWERKSLAEVESEAVSYKFNPMAFAKALLSAASPAIRDAALEEAAEHIDQMNESAGDSAAYDKRDMDAWEKGGQFALNSAATRLRAMKSQLAAFVPAPKS